MGFLDSFGPWQGFKAGLLPQEHVRRVDRYRGMGWLVRFGIATQAMETLVSGAFLVALALQLGANNLVIGILIAIPQIAALAQLIGAWLVEKFRCRKLIVVAAGSISRPGLVLVAVAPFLSSQTASLICLMTGLAIRYGFGCILNSGWMAWVRDLIPENIMGRYFAQRYIWIALSGAIVTVAGAVIVDIGKHLFEEKYIYSVLAAIAFFFGTLSIYCMRQVPEPRMAPNEDASLPFHYSLRLPFRDDNFRRLMIFLVSWNFAANLALPFFNVHMLQTLQLPLTAVMILTVFSQLSQTAAMRIWGPLTDRYNNKLVLGFCCPLLIACIFAWIFVDDISSGLLQYGVLIIIFALTGVAVAGTTLCTNNINLKLAPQGKAAAYLSTSTMGNALATGLAPIIGGSLADFFGDRTLTITINWNSPNKVAELNALTITHWDFFFLIAAILGLFALRQLRNVKERGQISESPIYMAALGEAAKTFSSLATIEGFRSMMIYPWRYWQKHRRRKGRRLKG